MTQQAQSAKPTSRSAAYGEAYVCPRCKGIGGGSWHVQFGTCFKCYGAGVVTKPDPNVIIEIVQYVVECSNGLKFYPNSQDKATPDLIKTAWIGDVISFPLSVGAAPIEGVVLAKRYEKRNGCGKILEERKSKNWNNA